MIPIQTQERVVSQNSNVGRSMNYRLDARNLRHIVTMLRDSVYSNKLLAILREYSTNALDAHVAAEESGSIGMRNRPIEVHLPTKFSPELRIRDFGPGLSTKEIEEIYISLGESTKRQSNKYVGSLGFGCKSAFAYGDRFLVTSWNNGKKIVYNNVLDDNVPEGARCDIMAETTCDFSETGIEICIPIRQNEIEECKQVALNFFKYWTVFPVMTGVDPTEIDKALSFKKAKTIFQGDNWAIYPSLTGTYGGIIAKGIALMGDVPYIIDWELVKRKLSASNTINSTESVLFEFIQTNNAILNFDIGDLEFSVSRESLQYTDYTCQAILDRLNIIFKSIFKIVEKSINDADNIWDAKIIYGSIFKAAHYLGSEYIKPLFEGGLYRLVPHFKGKLKWRGIDIDSSDFTGVYGWEKSLGKTLDSNRIYDENYHSIITSFTERNGRLRKYGGKTNGTRRRRAYNHDNCVIDPSHNAIVLINDLNNTRGLQTIVRYVIQNMSKRMVYVLDFGNDKVKKDFYTEYNFESVPVTYASTLLNQAKVWHISNLKTLGTYSARYGQKGPLKIRYIQKNASSNNRFPHQGYWPRGEINISDILKNKVNYYVVVNGEEIAPPVANNLFYLMSISVLIDNLNSLGTRTDWLQNIDIIYGLPPRTVNSRWFKKAVSAGKFVNIFDYLTKKFKEIDADTIYLAIKYRSYISTLGYSESRFSGSKPFIDAIFPFLSNQNGKMIHLCKLWKSVDLNVMNTISALEKLKINAPPKSHKMDIDFEKEVDIVNKEYPMLSLLSPAVNNRSQWEPTVLEKIADYINMVDSKI